MLGLVSVKVFNQILHYAAYPSEETHHCGSSHAAGAGISE